MGEKLYSLFKEKGPVRTIGVIGMGYVGIPSAVLFADSPFHEQVMGFQRNSISSGYKIEMLNKGICPLKGEDPSLKNLLKKVTNEGKFVCTSDFSKVSDADAVTIAIQTPFKNPGDLIPDLMPLKEGLAEVGQNISEGSLVVIESTVTPGTTEGFARKILEKESGMKAGDDFGLAHAPERVMVGRLIENIREYDRIVGGINKESTIRAAELYRSVLTTGKVLPMDAVSAEVTKTAENSFRDLQIAAANQLALYCEAMGINFFDVRKGIDSLKGEGVTRAVLYPGAGVGGHCLTKDTYHLERGLKIIGKNLDNPLNFSSLFINARNINDFMPKHMFNLTFDALKELGQDIRNTKIAILGWAFIKNSDDTRNTPSKVYYDICKKKGAWVSVHDPYAEDNSNINIEKKIENVIADSDVISIFTAHDCYRDLDPVFLKAACRKISPIIVDGRDVVDPVEFVKEGFIYKGIGRGDKNNT